MFFLECKDQLTKDNFGEIRSFSSNPNRRKSGGGQPVIRNVVNAMLPMSLLSSILKPFGDSEKMMGNEDMPNNSADSTGDLGEVSSIDNISIVRKKPALATVVIRNEKVVKDKLNESTSVLSTTTVPVLIPGLDISQQLELVPPDVYQTLFLWYGGGPHISRKVIMNDIGKAELELYPMLIRVCRCDINGNPSADEKEFMFSKMATIGELIKGLCTYHRCPEDNAKLWDYSSSDWKNQKLLSDTSKSLADFGMVDGQLLLLEVSLGNGTWPRSQRQAEMEADSASASNKGTLQASSSLTSLVSASKIATVGVSLSRSNLPGVFSAGNLQKVPLNKGRVGLDNLGNTCYMSSSLQVLLHTDQLVEYFLRKAYLKHVNIRSRHGYKGRLAHAFGKLVTNLWSTDKSSVSPRQFRAELSQIREEFAGNEQHDAQELMVFLLDGLSEDVNLVHEKPYIENPDSDERSDEELANIWWGNHKKRENSVIHALFTGQFKSVMKCANCKHTSARFEPFNSLALPLLEDHTKAIFVDVITLGCKFRIQKCIVIVKRTDNLVAVINKIIDESFGILGLASTSPHFLVAQISESRVQEFHPLNREVSNVSNNETISIYEVITPYTRMSQTNNDNVTSRNDQHKTELSTVISKEFSTAELAMEDGMDIIKDPPPEPEEKNEILNSLFKDKGDCIVGDANHGEVSRLVVVQRRAKYTVGIIYAACLPKLI